MTTTNRFGSHAVLPFLLALLAGCADGPLAPGAGGPVASVAVAPAGLALEVGATVTLTARPLAADGAVLAGHPIAWSSSDTVVATVSPAGLVRARAAGTATIRATSAGKTGTVAVTVGQRPVAWIQITPAAGTLPQPAGTTRQLGVVARAQDGTELTGRAVAWSSSDPAVASVSATGLLQAHAAGAAWIRAVVDGRRDSTLVVVPTLIARIATDPLELALGVGDARTVAATALDAQGNPLARPFTWSSTNGGVATVDAAGRVVATGAGTALVIVASEGRQATVRVTVTGQMWGLTRAGGAPLPATLYATTTTVNGVEVAAVVQVTGGTLRLRDDRYELRLQGWLLAEGAAPVATTLASDGVVAYDVLTGAPLFFEGSEWVNREPRFRSRVLADGRLELGWRRGAGTPVVPLVFAR